MQLVSDEIYHGIGYPGAADVLRVDDLARGDRRELASPSTSSMTGWRLGWLLVPERLRRAVDRLTGNFTICPPALAQHAAVAAFTPDGYAEADEHVARYAVNRALLLDGLAALGIDPAGPRRRRLLRLRRRRRTSPTTRWLLDQRLLAETGVALAPGVDFDPVDGAPVRSGSRSRARRPTCREALDRLGWMS